MTPEEYRRELDNVIWLVSCAVNETAPDPARVRELDLPLLHEAASRHMLTAAVAMALESAGVHDEQFTRSKASAMRRVALMDIDMAAVAQKLEAAGIWYMPLKGILLKEDYPAFGMREMADHDVLFDASRAEDVRGIMESLGFHTERFGLRNDDVYHKKPVSSFEMHRDLMEKKEATGQRLVDYYRDVKDRLVPDADRPYRYHFTPEDFYLYMIAHEYKHYANGGTGLRSLLDTYVFLRRRQLDMDYVRAETEKMDIADYEAANRSLSMHLFGGEALTDADREMLEYICSSGTFGTVYNGVVNAVRRSGSSRLRYMLGRFTVPLSRKDLRYDAFAEQYPVFYRFKILLPLLPIWRILRSLSSGRIRREMSIVNRERDTKKL
ncbi:MAG: nucleotidyltransferase family protein [Oscillospiraceae bacterium]|nr:nucleotidyltransferase family protein [Oscillospiraceae bacterium]